MRTIAVSPNRKLQDYEEAVRDAGGEPRLIDRATESPAEVIARSTGLLLTGGGDVLPSIYGAAAHPTFSAAEPGRDDYEIALVQCALDADLPVFAICRGIQLLNVARGGTLVQDIPDERPASLNHALRDPLFAIAHDIQITPDSLLDRVMRAGARPGHVIPVNSRHHQAVKTLGNGLEVTATAPDGIIEAIEDPSRRFCLGVQWHPENFYRTGEFRALFDGFVNATR